MKLTTDDPKLTAYALGELPAAERAAVEAELRPSPELRRAVEEVRRMEKMLSRELAAEPCPAVRPTQMSQALVSSSKPPTLLARLFTFFLPPQARWKFELVLAGYAVVVTVALAVMLWPRQPSLPEVAAQPAANAPGSESSAASVSPVQPPLPELRPIAGGPERSPHPQPPVSPKAPKPIVPPPAPPAQVAVAPNSPPSIPPSPPSLQPQPVAPSAAPMAPLALVLPMPSFKGTPDDLPKGPNIEAFTEKARSPFMAPAGVINLALNKKVTSSDKSPITGDLSLITDGNKEAIDDAVVELHKGVQWVQIDLAQEVSINAILVWHDHRYVQVFRCVVVQVADDPDFTRNVRTLFNNDYENVAGLGLGTDKQYFETHQGRLIDARGAKARYLRFYSKGSNASALNCYTEVDVWGLPAGTASLGPE